MLKVFDIKKSLPSIFTLSLLFALASVCLLIFGDLEKKSWTPGVMSKSHGFIEKDCKTCHLKGFQKIQDQTCITCHNLTNHSKEHEKDKSCVNCHSEHNGQAGLTYVKDSNCLACHKNINHKYEEIELKNVNSFIKHPEFQNLELDSSTIKLNHALHLEPDLRGVNGPQQLNCNNCHQVDKLGRRMKPINFESHCLSCHSLEFDERLPSKAVPHGKTDIVYNFLFREYSALYLSEEKVEPEKRLIRPGIESSELKTAEYAFKRVREVTRDSEKDLIAKRGCFLCHDVVRRDKIEEDKSAFEIKNPNLPKIWMKKAVFKHGSHEFAKCETCHEKAKTSEKTPDVLLPKIKDCTSCHGLNNAPSDCLTCHSYHDSLAIEFDNKHAANKFIK